MSNISDSASEYSEEEIQTDVPVDKLVAPIIVTNRPRRQTKPSAKIRGISKIGKKRIQISSQVSQCLC